MRYFRIWGRSASMAFALAMEYRLSFVLLSITGLVELVMAVLTFAIIFDFAPEVAGWTQSEALMLAGVYKFVDGVISFAIAPNMIAIGGYVNTGEFDQILLLPISSQFLVSTRIVYPPGAVKLVAGLCLAAYAGSELDVDWNAVRLLTSLVFILLGIVSLYCVWMIIVTLSFWVMEIRNLESIFYSLFETARYPASFFDTPIRIALTYLFPVAFATTLPTQSLIGTADGQMLLIGIFISTLALATTHLFWRYALRRYSSASS